MNTKKIKELRMANSISQQELADELFVSRQTISRWENEITIPSSDVIAQIADYFGVDINFFYENTPKIENNRKSEMIDYWKRTLSHYSKDILLICLAIFPFFYVLLTPISYVSLYYSIKKRKKYTVIIAITVSVLTILFVLQLIVILQFLFGIGGSTTEFIMD